MEQNAGNTYAMQVLQASWHELPVFR
jgi:hypothetical protein